MNDDTRRLIYGTIVAFLLFIVFWLGFVYISACGFTLDLSSGRPFGRTDAYSHLDPCQAVAGASRSNGG